MVSPVAGETSDPWTYRSLAPSKLQTDGREVLSSCIWQPNAPLSPSCSLHGGITYEPVDGVTLKVFKGYQLSRRFVVESELEGGGWPLCSAWGLKPLLLLLLLNPHLVK